MLPTPSSPGEGVTNSASARAALARLVVNIFFFVVVCIGCSVSGFAGDAYPLSATLIPWNDQIHAQQYLDADAALAQPKGCRLEGGKDYAFEVNWKPGPATGWMPPLTLRSGMRLYGLNNGTQAIAIAPDAHDVVVSHVQGALTFQAGSPEQVIRNCTFIGLHYAAVTGAGARIRDCLFLDFYNGGLWCDMAASGFLRNNRFIRTQSQGGTAAFYAKGNAAEPSGGNVLLGWSALTMGDEPTGTDVGRYHIENHTDATLVNGSAENYSGRAWPIVRVLGTPDVKLFGAISFSQGLAFVDTDATRLWLHAAQIATQNTDTTYRNLILRPGVKSLLDVEALNARLATDQEPAPDLRAKLFEYSYNTVVVNGTAQPTAPIAAAAAAEIRATAANRTHTPWARPTLPTPPAAATGPASGTLTAVQIQALLDTQSTVYLSPGIYDIDRPLRLGWIWTDLTTPGLHPSLRGHFRTLVGAGKGRTYLRATAPTIDLIVQGGSPYSDVLPNDPTYNGGTDQLRLTDLTLQGGRWGISLTGVNGSNGVALFQSYTDNLFSSVCIRDMAAGGLRLDGIYAWDNCCTTFVDFVNCPIGLQQVGHSGIDSTPNLTYMDKCLFYGCQWVGCAAGLKMTSGRASNSDHFVDCVFRDCTSFAVDSQIDGCVLANCEFTDNAGAPVMLNRAPTSIISCNFSATTRDAVSFIDGITLNVEGCTFTRSAGRQVVVIRETTGYNDPLNWQDSVNPGNRGPYLGRHIHFSNSTIGVPLGQWYNGTAIECTFLDAADAALRSRLVWTQAPGGNWDPWPVPAASISRHVLVAGTSAPWPQLLVGATATDGSVGAGATAVLPPTVLHTSSGIQPDRTILVRSRGGAATGAELVRLPDGAAGAPAAAPLVGLGWAQVPLLAPTPHSSAVGIPINWTPGVFALRLSGEAGTGPAVRVNAPEPIWVQGDQGETASPGGYLRVGGACLQLAGKTATLALVSGTTLAASIQPSDTIRDHLGIAYGATFALPAGLAPGTYEVWLHNGGGGANGWTKWSTFIASRVSTFTVAAPASWPTTTVSYAAQAGTPDQRIAACFAAVANGGVVVLPDGITSGFTGVWDVPDKVLIRSTTGGIQARPTWTADPAPNTPLLRGKLLSGSPITRAAFNLTDVVVVASPTFYFSALAKEFCTTPTVWLRSGAVVPRPLDNDENDLGPCAFRLRAARNHRIVEPVGIAAQGVFGREDCRYVEVTGGTMHWTGFDFYVDGGAWAWWIDGVDRILDGDPTANHWAAAANPNPGTGVALFYSNESFCRAILFARCTDTRTNSFPWQASDKGTTAGFTGDGGSCINYGPVAAAGTVLTFAQANLAGTYTGSGALARIVGGTGAGDERFVLAATPGAMTVALESAFAELDDTSVVAVNPAHGDVLMIDNDLRCRPLIQSYGMTRPLVLRGNLHGVSPTCTAVVLQQGIDRRGQTIPAGALEVSGADAVYGPLLVKLQSQVIPPEPGASGGEVRDAAGNYSVDFAVRALPTPVVDFFAEAINGTAAAKLGVDVPNFQGGRLRLIAGAVTPLPLPAGVTLLSSLPHVTLGGTGQPSGAPSFASLAAIQSGIAGGFFTLSAAASDATIYEAYGLPPGLVINPATGLISGTVTTLGNFSAVLVARGPGGTAAIPRTFKFSCTAPTPTTWTDTGTGLRYSAITFSRLVGSGGNLIVETSTDLLAWSSATAEVIPQGLPVVAADGLTEAVLYRDLRPINTEPRRFFRVRVTVP